MRPLRAKVSNFGSYKQLEFNFENQGLALIHGATGSGKSTVQDLVTWCTYGKTAKDGNADDVKSWKFPDEPVSGTITVDLGTSTLEINRIRGKSSQNDLVFYIDGDHTNPQRGKNILETQSLIDSIIGVDYYSYVLGAYYNEFSPTGSFFTAKAQDRKALFESISNLEFPTKLIERISNAGKETRKAQSKVSEEFRKQQGKLEQLREETKRNSRAAKKFSEDQAKRIKELEVKNQQFEAEVEQEAQLNQLKFAEFEANRKRTIAKLFDQINAQKLKAEIGCPQCGFVSAPIDWVALAQEQISGTANQLNPYKNFKPKNKKFYLDLLEAEKATINPFMSQILSINCDTLEMEAGIEALENQVDALTIKLQGFDQLRKIAENLVQELRKNTIATMESEVNRILETYFDSEIKVAFESDGVDKLEVKIWKSGYECAYRQLSKGQRSLLKLSFSISIMKAMSNKCGVYFDTLCFDEALDGLDTDLKVKAFRLLEELSLNHSTVLVIDHDQSIKELFNKRYYVKIDSDISSIIEE